MSGVRAKRIGSWANVVEITRIVVTTAATQRRRYGMIWVPWCESGAGYGKHWQPANPGMWMTNHPGGNHAWFLDYSILTGQGSGCQGHWPPRRMIARLRHRLVGEVRLLHAVATVMQLAEFIS